MVFARALFLAVLLLGSAGAFAQKLQPIPPFTSLVTDLTGTLTANQRAEIARKLDAFEARKGATVAVLIVPTVEPETIEQYGIRVAEQWQAGRKASDDGALLIIAKNDRNMRIEVGYGLEGVLTDALSRRIIADTITPLFRQGDFPGGINAGLDQMLRVIDGEPLPEPDRKWTDAPFSIGNLFAILFILVPVFSFGLRRVLGRALGSVAMGGLAGFVVWVIGKGLIVALIAALLAFFFALLTGFSRPGGSSPTRYGRRGFPGVFPGGFGGGGFGGGGGVFRGGGGGFGGGGASGRW